MDISCFTVGPFAENTYLLTRNKRSVLIDPGFHSDDEVERLVKTFESLDSRLEAIILTHAHVDHMLGLNRVLARYDLPVYLSDQDRYLWENYVSQAKMFGFDVQEVALEPQPIPENDSWQVGGFTFEVRYTPGHAPDHISLYLAPESLLIAGDALFREGIGRTDLYKGSFELLERSIREQLYTLPDDTVVYPGHGPETTIGHERRNNPFVSDPNRD